MPEDCSRYRGRSQRICLRQQGRTDRVETRQNARTDRNSNKWNAAQVSYANGIDFSQNRMGAWANSAANMTTSLSSAASSILTPNAFGSMFGNGVFAKGDGGKDEKDTGKNPSFFEGLVDTLKNNLLAVFVGGAALFLLRKTL